LLFSSNIGDIEEIKWSLAQWFEIKDLGEVKWTLQMKVEHCILDNGTRILSISQEQYVETILEQHGIATCSPCKTPMGMNLQLLLLTEPKVCYKLLL